MRTVCPAGKGCHHISHPSTHTAGRAACSSPRWRSPAIPSTSGPPGRSRHSSCRRTPATTTGPPGVLVSELVTNSLRHSDSGNPGGTITVTVAITPNETVVQVTDDGGPAEPDPGDPGDTDAEDGRGLWLVGELSAGWGFFRRDSRLVTWFELKAERHDDMSDYECGCGFQADSAADLSDHLGEVFLTGDDIAPDGRVHAEAGDGAPGTRCLCGLTVGTGTDLDDHLLRAFTPDDCVGRDGAKHRVAAAPA